MTNLNTQHTIGDTLLEHRDKLLKVFEILELFPVDTTDPKNRAFIQAIMANYVAVVELGGMSSEEYKGVVKACAQTGDYRELLIVGHDMMKERFLTAGVDLSRDVNIVLGESIIKRDGPVSMAGIGLISEDETPDWLIAFELSHMAPDKIKSQLY